MFNIYFIFLGIMQALISVTLISTAICMFHFFIFEQDLAYFFSFVSGLISSVISINNYKNFEKYFMLKGYTLQYKTDLVRYLQKHLKYKGIELHTLEFLYFRYADSYEKLFGTRDFVKNENEYDAEKHKFRLF